MRNTTFNIVPKGKPETQLNIALNKGEILQLLSDEREAEREVFPDVPWQRCQFHFSKNIADKAPKKVQAGLRTELQETFNCKKIEDARKSGTRFLPIIRNPLRQP